MAVLSKGACCNNVKGYSRKHINFEKNPGIFHCFTLPLEIPNKTNLHPWIPQSCIRPLWNSKTNIQQRRPMETPHYFFGAIALSYPPPYCYWWLIIKKCSWKLYRSPNPNPRGVRKCNSAIFSAIFSWSPLEIPLFLINPWKFHMLFLWYIWKFHNPQPPSPVFFFLE